jgi:hypothetical protein
MTMQCQQRVCSRGWEGLRDDDALNRSLAGKRDNPLVPGHLKMRAFGRDPLRGGHHGQRPFAPLQQVEHMAAPTNSASIVKKPLANGVPSAQGTTRTAVCAFLMFAL